MESPNKRLKLSPAESAKSKDFVPLNFDEDVGNSFGYGEEESFPQAQHPARAPRAAYQQHDQRVLQDRRHAQDRPKSRHVLPGDTSWILIRTKFRRRFVHNTVTKESLWRIPAQILQLVIDLENPEAVGQEVPASTNRASGQTQPTEAKGKAVEIARAPIDQARSRRRRSESLQKEDEAILMAEMAAESEKAEEQDVKQVLDEAEDLQPQAGEMGYDSEGSFEYVEVTDNEGEEEHDVAERAEVLTGTNDGEEADANLDENGHVEFGEDDIAYQLAAMGNDYGLDAGEYGNGEDYEEWEEGAEGLLLSDEDAANLFRDLLDDYHVSPFTPWDKLIADVSPSSILNDDRYTVLTSTRARKDVWDAWVKDKAAQIKAERAQMERQDTRIPYLAFLSERATPKLYWPEFKRKYKREGAMNDRHLSDKDREKLYREHTNRLKLPEMTRKADLQNLLRSMPLRALNRSTTLDTLPQQLLTHLHFISLPLPSRDSIIESHIQSLGPAPSDEDAEMTEEQEKKRAERRKRELAMSERERQVEEDKRKTEKEERFAKRALREEEAELRRAMAIRSGGVQSLIAE